MKVLFLRVVFWRCLALLHVQGMLRRDPSWRCPSTTPRSRSVTPGSPPAGTDSASSKYRTQYLVQFTHVKNTFFWRAIFKTFFPHSLVTWTLAFFCNGILFLKDICVGAVLFVDGTMAERPCCRGWPAGSSWPPIVVEYSVSSMVRS